MWRIRNYLNWKDAVVLTILLFCGIFVILIYAIYQSFSLYESVRKEFYPFLFFLDCIYVFLFVTFMANFPKLANEFLEMYNQNTREIENEIENLKRQRDKNAFLAAKNNASNNHKGNIQSAGSSNFKKNKEKSRYENDLKDDYPREELVNTRGTKLKRRALLGSSSFFLRMNTRRQEDSIVKLDFISLQARKHEIGLKGEAFVFELEKERLRKLGLKNLSDCVIHLSKEYGDGYGYDILSYNEQFEQIHIEVKTTLNALSEPFYISENEYQVMKEIKNYFIYRVYNFNEKKRKGIVKVIDCQNDFDELFVLEVDQFIAKPK